MIIFGLVRRSIRPKQATDIIRRNWLTIKRGRCPQESTTAPAIIEAIAEPMLNMPKIMPVLIGVTPLSSRKVGRNGPASP